MGGGTPAVAPSQAFEGQFFPHLDKARHYPALLALRAMGLVALHTGHDGVLLRLFTEANYRKRFEDNARLLAVQALHDASVLNAEVIQTLPRWNGTRWH